MTDKYARAVKVNIERLYQPIYLNNVTYLMISNKNKNVGQDLILWR